MNVFDIKSEKFKVVKINNEEFKISAILPRERSEIAVKRSYLQGGMNVDSFLASDIDFFEKVATVDVCVIEKPNRYEESDSCRDWLDQTIIDDLYSKIKKRTKILEEKLKKNRSSDGSTQP